MKSKLCLLALLCVGLLSFSNGETLPSPALPQMAQQFFVEAVYSVPYFNISQPIRLLYDGVNNRQRWEFYNGMDISLNFFNETNSYEITPHLGPNKWCETVPSEDLENHSIFPAFDSNWKYNGETTVKNVRCQDWVLNTVNFNKTGTYHFYIDSNFGIPVQLYMDGVDIIFDAHPDIWIIDYLLYIPNYTNASAFQVPDLCNASSNLPLVQTNKLAPLEPKQSSISNIRKSMADISQTQQQNEDLFNQFLKKFNRNYATIEEHHNRKSIFVDNMRYINSINQKELGFKLAINHFGDLTHEEFKSKILLSKGLMASSKQKIPQKYTSPFNPPKNVPASVDWRNQGAVTPVKDQSSCGSCWTFGTTGSLEGVYFVSTKKLVSLSEQQIVDCNNIPGLNDGCNGGITEAAFQWIIDNGGIATEANYPYLGQDGICNAKDHSSNVSVKSYVNVTSGDENALMQAVALNPVAVAIDASQPSFRFYYSGVYYAPECKNDPNDLDHEVLAVGYGSVNGQDYWLVKNSWSTHWGDVGFVQMSRNRDNNCGIATDACYPVV